MDQLAQTLARAVRLQVLHFKSLSDLITEARKLVPQLPRDIRGVVGIPRSGMIPAYAIGLACDLPVWSVPEFIANAESGRGSTRGQDRLARYPTQAGQILLVDDSLRTGDSLRRARDVLQTAKTAPTQILTCAIFVSPGAKVDVDIVGPSIESPHLFEWNFVSHHILQESCVDMDGILCFDPPPEIDGDGPSYIEFLKSASPRYRLNRKIKAIVSARLNRYRALTEDWLGRHDVKYDKLYLLDAPSAAHRRRLGLHAPFKATIYRESGAACFFESETYQAQQIANLSGQSVVCTDAMRLMMPRPAANSPYWIRRIAKPIARRLKLVSLEE